MNHVELQQTHIDSYNLAANYCRTYYAMGVVSTYVHKSLKFLSTDLEKYCKEKDFKACALKLHLNFKSVCITTIYRAPSGTRTISKSLRKYLSNLPGIHEVKEL